MFEECLKNVFPDYPLSSYFYAGEGVGVDVTENEKLLIVYRLFFFSFFHGGESYG